VTSTAAIAEAMQVEPDTVKHHLRWMMLALGCHN
jgi:DNA-binding NarL/FixJ family response regulator